MVDEFNEERARQFTIDSLRATAELLKANRDLVLKILVEDLGAPNEEAARNFDARMQLLLGIVAGTVAKSKSLHDAMAKPGSKEMH